MGIIYDSKRIVSYIKILFNDFLYISPKKILPANKAQAILTINIIFFYVK